MQLTATVNRIKLESLNNDFIRQTKTKACEKDLRYFLPTRWSTAVQWASRPLSNPMMENPDRFPCLPPRDYKNEKPDSQLRVLADHG